MEGRYLNYQNALSRLLKEYQMYGSLYIAFDFDHTVYDFDGVGDTFHQVENRLKQAKEQGHKLILFTCREGERLQFAIDYCTEHGYAPDYINESPIKPGHTKPYYNLLLDDRAGLDSAFQTLCYLLNNIEYLKG